MGQNSVVVREARQGDSDWILEELQAFDAVMATDRSFMPSDPKVRRSRLHEFMADQLFLVAVRGEERLGFVLGVYANHLLNPETLCIYEQLYWVSHRHRGSAAGLVLLDTFIAVASRSVDWIFFSKQPWTRMADRHLDRRGFKPVDHTFLLEVTGD